jgi:hypothetical protein
MNYELFHVNYRVTDSAHQKKTAAAGPFSWKITLLYSNTH